MECKNCQKTTRDSIDYCYHCGFFLRQSIAKEVTDYAFGFKTIVQPEQVACPICGTRHVEEGTIRCRSCGETFICIGHLEPNLLVCSQCVRMGEDDRKSFGIPEPEDLSKLKEIILENAPLYGMNLHRFDLSHANLRNANLRGANLSGAQLCNACLNNADLSRANLESADLSNADLSDTKLPFANLGKANLSLANLNNAHFDYADLREANLNSANLVNADLCGVSLLHTTLIGARMNNVDLRGSFLNFADFSKSDLRNANFCDAGGSDVNFCQADMRGISCTELSLIRADLSNVLLDQTRLYEIGYCEDVNMSSASLCGATLSPNIHRINLSHANLRDTKFPFIDLESYILEEADLSDADLSKISQPQKFMVSAVLSTVKTLKGAKMPDGTIHE